MNNNELQELAKLAKEKGFKTHTVTTGYTFTYLLGGKNIMINETCIYLFLCEIQKWLREVHKIDIMILPWEDTENNTVSYQYFILNNFDEEKYDDSYVEEKNYDTYEKSLEIGLQEALKLINN